MKDNFPSLIPYRKGQLWGYSDRDKHIKIAIQYDQAYPFVGNIARVIKNGLSGLIDREGEEILPPAYEEVGSIITGVFMNENGTCSIYHEGKYGLVSIRGEVLAEVTFESEENALAHAEANGWKGAILPERCPDMPLEMIEQIEAIKDFQNDMAPFKQSDQWGLIASSGDVRCEPSYDNIEPAENGYWPCEKDGKWGLLDVQGNELIKPQFDQARGFSNGQAACKRGAHWGAIDSSGKWMIEPTFSELGELKDGLVAAQKEGLFGFTDAYGNTVIDFQFQDVMDFDEGVCAVFHDDQIYFIDTEGKQIGDSYTRLFGPNRAGLIHVMVQEKWGLIKTNGQFILPIEYDIPRAMGQVVHTIEEERIPIKKGALLGYTDMEGKEIVAPTYVISDPFWEGLSMVAILDEKLNFGNTPEKMEMTGNISGVFKYGFIDRAGNEVVPLKYNLVRRFERGLAFVQSEDGQAGYITYDGTEYFED